MLTNTLSFGTRQLVDPVSANSRCSIDETVAAVQTCLSDSPSLAGNRIRCEASGCRIVLRGYVATYSMKQMARVLAESVSGDNRVEDRLDVIPSPAQWNTHSTPNSRAL
ncbi:MAG: BON domain-containing protein [Thermoguttaceae bacterium]